jgi:hypothetical protein
MQHGGGDAMTLLLGSVAMLRQQFNSVMLMAAARLPALVLPLLLSIHARPHKTMPARTQLSLLKKQMPVVSDPSCTSICSLEERRKKTEEDYRTAAALQAATRMHNNANWTIVPGGLSSNHIAVFFNITFSDFHPTVQPSGEGFFLF